MPAGAPGTRKRPANDGGAPPELARSSVLGWALRRQHLAEGTSGDDVLPVIEDLLGLHATVPLSPYLQLHARTTGFVAAQLDSLLDDGRAARVGCMRRTLFIETAELVPLVLAATRSLSLRAVRYLEANGLTTEQYESLAERIVSALTGRAMTVRQLTAAIGADQRLSPVVTVLCDESRLLRWRSRQGWRSGQPAYRRFDEVLPGAVPDARETTGAVRELVARYVARYGPVTESDITWWSGLRRATVREAVDGLTSAGTLVPVTVQDLDGAFLVAATDLETALAAPPPPAGEVSLLPVLDPYLQSHAHRSRFVGAAHLPYVVDRGGNATSVVLAGGRVVGVWDNVQAPRPEARLLFFEPPAGELRRRVVRAAGELAAFLTGTELPVVECTHMEPLARSTGAFLSPLRHAH